MGDTTPRRAGWADAQLRLRPEILRARVIDTVKRVFGVNFRVDPALAADQAIRPDRGAMPPRPRVAGMETAIRRSRNHRQPRPRLGAQAQHAGELVGGK